MPTNNCNLQAIEIFYDVLRASSEHFYISDDTSLFKGHNFRLEMLSMVTLQYLGKPSIGIGNSMGYQ